MNDETSWLVADALMILLTAAADRDDLLPAAHREILMLHADGITRAAREARRDGIVHRGERAVAALRDGG